MLGNHPQLKYILLKGSWIASGWGLVTGKTRPGLEIWEKPYFSHRMKWGEGRALDEVNDQSCLHSEAVIKVPKLQALTEW
jgi:hypothetical protein